MKPVIAIIDVGKTNKKLFLFDQNYKIVYERTAKFIETTDEDGDPCENLESLRLSVFDSLHDVFRQKEFDLKALNFSTYGASFVLLDKNGKAVAPLYNYLKQYPEDLKTQFYETYGGEEKVSLQTASPVLGNLNSGMQLYRIKYQKPEVYKQTKYALHLPQYLSYLITGNAWSDITSVGCHTALWNFRKYDYHTWVKKEGIIKKLAPIADSDYTSPATFPGNTYCCGIGLHDSSAALIPYLVNFHEPFVLISTGTWCISLNPFNSTPLTQEELKQDCLCYLNYKGEPVKASRLFAGYEHEEQTKKIAAAFHLNLGFFKTIDYNPDIITKLRTRPENEGFAEKLQEPVTPFVQRNWADYDSAEEAYHQFMLDIILQQYRSTNLVLKGTAANRIFVDGGFSKNSIFMNLLASVYPKMEVFAASMAQATAMGAALAIHSSWNKKTVPNDIIELKYFSAVKSRSLV